MMAATAGIPARPALAPQVELVGEMKESGFTQQQWLVQRDGRFIQLTELLYRICEQADGEQTLEEIAARVTDSTEWSITPDQVRLLIQTKLVPLGLIGTIGDEAATSSSADRSASPLRLNLRTAVIRPHIIDPITRVLQVLYAPFLLIPILFAVTIAHGWMYLRNGSALLVGLRDILFVPEQMLATLGILLLAGVVHEFGHAAALRYGGGKVRGMGVGIYLIYPAIYTDTTDAYRLGRWARVRTDLGGFYFYLIFALFLIGLYQLTGQPFLLVAVVLINFDILYQSLPFVRFDGYWAVADLTGIPDLFTYMKPFLKSMLPGSKGERLPQLKPWVRRVFLTYILSTVPVLMIFLALFVTRAPWLLATTFDSYVHQGGAFTQAFNNGDVVGMVLSVIQMAFLALLFLGIGYLIYNLSRKLIGGIWSVTRRRLRVS
jgi:putative peptide zinc metalloprotease protein